MSMQAKLEALLFVSIKPIALAELAKFLKKDKAEIEKTLEDLANTYQERKSGLALINSNGKYQLTSSPEQAEMVKKFLKSEASGELSQPSLETLTIIAYRSPVSKSELEMIRGVNCSLILRNLLMRGLVEEKFDRSKQENYYSVSTDFLRHLGLESVKDLPDFENLSQNRSLEEVLSQTQEN